MLPRLQRGTKRRTKTDTVGKSTPRISTHSFIFGFALVLVVACAVFLGGRSFTRPTLNGKKYVKLSESHWLISASERDNFLRDPERVYDGFRLKPLSNKSTNKIDGLVISWLSQDSPLRAGGFREGDVIIKINGSDVGTVERALNLLNEVKVSKRLTINYKRDGQELKKTFDFK